MRRAVVILALVCALAAGAVGPFDWHNVEPGFGYMYSRPTTGFHGGIRDGSPGMYVEARYHFPSTRWDLGVIIDWTEAPYNFSGGTNADDVQTNTAVGMMAVADYNLNHGGKCNLFFGLGAGVAYDGVWRYRYYPTDNRFFPLVMPRVGVTLFRYFRFAAERHVQARGYSTWNITFGINFPRRRRGAD